MKNLAATLLMFEGRAEEAMNFYGSLFPDSEIVNITRYAEGEAGAVGSIKRADFALRGHQLICIDSHVKHGFSFTPSISIYVECSDASELEKVYAALSEGGQIFMPLDNYGFSTKFGWVGDRFGVSWQLNLE